MYISKSDLIIRLVKITGKHRSEFTEYTREYLLSLYESYASEETRIYLKVPYKDKDLIKIMGAKYDGEKKMWYLPSGVDVKPFEKWLPTSII